MGVSMTARMELAENGGITHCHGREPEENPGPACYCGKRGCMEMWVSGTGIALDYKETTGRTRTTREIVSDFEAGDEVAAAIVERFEDRLARGLGECDQYP